MTRPLALNRRRFLATAAAGGLVMLHPFSARAQAGQAHLRVISTTDLHCNVQPYDYYADKPVDTVGLARTGSIIEAIRAEATNTLLVDNGDYLQGNPMGDYIAYKRGMKAGDIHPVIAGMNTLAYEVGHARQPRVQLRGGVPRPRQRRGRVPDRLRQLRERARGRRRARTSCT